MVMEEAPFIISQKYRTIVSGAKKRILVKEVLEHRYLRKRGEEMRVQFFVVYFYNRDNINAKKAGDYR
jgi:hypothetical protein